MLEISWETCAAAIASRKTFHEARCGFVSVVHGKAPWRSMNRPVKTWETPGPMSTPWLVGGWTNPSEKYARQIGNLPQFSGRKCKKYLKPPLRQHRLHCFTVWCSRKSSNIFGSYQGWHLHTQIPQQQKAETTHAQFEELHHSKSARNRIKMDMMLKMHQAIAQFTCLLRDDFHEEPLHLKQESWVLHFSALKCSSIVDVYINNGLPLILVDLSCQARWISPSKWYIIKGSLVANFRYTNFWVAGQE